MSGDPPISKAVLEHQLALLRFIDSGILSSDGKSKMWITPSGDFVGISNHDWVPAYVFHKLLRELEAVGSGVYGTP